MLIDEIEPWPVLASDGRCERGGCGLLPVHDREVGWWRTPKGHQDHLCHNQSSGKET